MTIGILILNLGESYFFEVDQIILHIEILSPEFTSTPDFTPDFNSDLLSEFTSDFTPEQILQLTEAVLDAPETDGTVNVLLKIFLYLLEFNGVHCNSRPIG